MKLALLFLISVATPASNSTFARAFQMDSDLPDSRFRIELIFDAPFLPVNPALVNIMHFMSIVAQVNFDEELQPRSYSAPLYRQVQITTYAWTEARFLLWGIYLAATDMVRFARFHNVMVKLYWDNILVGQINLIVSTGLGLPIATRNGTRSILDNAKEQILVGIGNKTTQAFVGRLKTPILQYITGSDTPDSISVVSSVKTGCKTFSSPSTSPSLVIPNVRHSPRFSIDFDRVGGAARLSRNDVFLAFYTAMLHVAKFPAENDIEPFNSKPPTLTLRVRMFESGIGCLYGQAITALAYVPQYMMEHPGFGYKETNFNVKLNGVRACRGSILDSLLDIS